MNVEIRSLDTREMKAQLARGLRRLLARLPENAVLFKLARFYANFCSGDDDSNFETNGEGRVLQKALPLCRTVFDVGANVGDWAALALAINPTLKLHCFEPAAATFKALVSRRLSSLTRCNNFGLSSTAGQAVLHTFGREATTNSLYPREGWKGSFSRGKESVLLRTLDDYCRQEGVEHIDYLKIDTEGHDLAVVEGGEEMLKSGSVSLIQLEYMAGYIEARHFLKDVVEYLSRWRFTAFKILPTRLAHVPRYCEVYENFRLSNWLFARDEDPIALGVLSAMKVTPG